jgi:multidrug efflux pump subunit AcrA (membrane-fusion protein)
MWRRQLFSTSGSGELPAPSGGTQAPAALCRKTEALPSVDKALELALLDTGPSPLSVRRQLLRWAMIFFSWSALVAFMPSPALAVPETSPVVRADLSSTALVGGTVVPERHNLLYFSPAAIQTGSGRPRRVKKVYVSSGQKVAAGDLLAELDGDDIEDQLDQARTQVQKALDAQRQAEAAARAQAERLEQTKAQAEAARASEQQANTATSATQNKCTGLANKLVQTAIAEISSLPPGPPPSPQQLPQTQAVLAELIQCQISLAQTAGQAGAAAATVKALEAQIAALASSTSRISSAGAQVSAARRQVDRLERAKRALSLHAPYDGVIAAVNLREGSTVPTASPAIEIRSEKLVARADLAEGDLLAVRPGAAAVLTVRSAHLELTTTVGTIADDPIASGGGPIAYPAYFELPPSSSLKPGQTVKVLIYSEVRRGVLVVPSSAITESKGQHFVVVVKDGKQEARRVIPGVSSETMTEILEGLSEGETVKTLASHLDLAT